MKSAMTMKPTTPPITMRSTGSRIGHQAGDLRVDDGFLVLGDLEQHLVELARLLADVDHVDDDVVEELRLAHRPRHRLALAHGVLDLPDRPPRDHVAGRVGGDVERPEALDAARRQRAEGAREPRDLRVPDDRARTIHILSFRRSSVRRPFFVRRMKHERRDEDDDARATSHPPLVGEEPRDRDQRLR